MRALLLLLSICYAWASSLQVISRLGEISSGSKVTNYLASQNVDLNTELDIISIIDCTGDNDCSFLNILFKTSFIAGKTGVQLDVSNNCAVLFSGYESIYSSSFCGSKAIDFTCALHASPAMSTVCVAFKIDELDFALQSYEQLFRRFIKYGMQRYRSDSLHSKPITLAVFIDGPTENGMEDIEKISLEKIERLLQSLWAESYDKTAFSKAVEVKVLVINPNNPLFLDETRKTWKYIRDVEGNHSSKKLRVASLTEGLKEEFSRSESNGDKASVGVGSLTAGKFGDLLEQLWERIPVEPIPVLSPTDQEALYAIETSYSRCLGQAEAGIRQWQTRVAKGRLVANFSSRISALSNAVCRDFERGVTGHTSPSLASERVQRLRMLKEHITGAVGRLYQQQLSVIEFQVLNGFRKELAKLISQDLTDEVRKEQERIQFLKAVASFRSQADDIECANLDLTLTAQREKEVTDTLESVMREFPESSLAKLEEVRRVERQVRSGRGPDSEAVGRGRKRKGLAKMLGVSLSLVGMLRPPGYGNLQGFVGYATSLLGLPLDLLLGVQNDGDSPEIMGEDREYPILRLQPKIKFDINLQ